MLEGLVGNLSFTRQQGCKFNSLGSKMGHLVACRRETSDKGEIQAKKPNDFNACLLSALSPLRDRLSTDKSVPVLGPVVPHGHLSGNSG